MNHTTKPLSITLMGIIITITATLYSPPVKAQLLIKNVTEAKTKAGQSCFAENNNFVAIYCNCRSQELDDGSGNCTDGSYGMVTSGWCKLPGGGDGIGTAYCVGGWDANNACSFCEAVSTACAKESISSSDYKYMYTEDGYSPYVYYYYEYKIPQTSSNYRCDGGTRTKKYTCQEDAYAYDIDASTGRIDECPQCPMFGNISATTTFPSTGTITSCYVPAGSYTDKTGTFDLFDNCYYTK